VSDHPRASGYVMVVNGALVDVLVLGATVPGLPFPPWYKPQVGDSVIVSWLGSQPYVETILVAAPPPPPPPPPPPVFSATQNTAQTGSPANTWIAVLFDAALIDTYGGHSNTTNPSRYTIPAGRGGVWSFEGVVAIDGTGAGGLGIAVNGAMVKGAVVAKLSSPPGAFATPAKLITVAAGDYVEVHWYLNVTTGTYVQTDFASSFDARFVQ